MALFPGRNAAPKARLRASVARYGDALQTQDRYELGVCDDPGSAVHHFVLHRIRETGVYRFNSAIRLDVSQRLPPIFCTCE